MTDLEFIELRKRVIEKDFSNLNKMQFSAVTASDGPVLILAGAGSGKTTVLVNRIAYIVKYGNAYSSDFVPQYTDTDVKQAQDFLDGKTDNFDNFAFSVNPVEPYRILAITFTNKAAGELKDRISAKLNGETDIWAGTFHSICGRILRRYAERIGYTSHFAIYDTDDTKRLMKDIMKQSEISDREFPVRSVLSQISSAKDKLITPDEYESKAGFDFRKKVIARLYKEYTKHLMSADAMDFDDMIANTVKLLKTDSEAFEYLNNRFKYVMVDEYQDTNYAQYVLVSLLSQNRRNICVVGDDDQSIYRFRGATIENILNFEDEYKETEIIRLEQNYRSTSNILNAANGIIANNRSRKEKRLWTDKKGGDKVSIYKVASERDEARRVADYILDDIRLGGKYSDHAVLYRTNAQSNAVENMFARCGIPYKVIGGLRFFDRKEIKDVLSYLCVICNHNDDVRLKRIINEPKRGIGNTTLNNASEIASSLGISLFEVLKNADNYALITRSAQKLTAFTDMIEQLSDLADSLTVNELVLQVLEKTGYYDDLKAQGDEGADRIENIKELSSSIIQYEEDNDEPSLEGFLEQVALVSDIDGYEENEDKVVLMTVHSSKGLEFDTVHLIGMEDGIFPSSQSIYEGESEIEEERRLAYVALTRAKRRLEITASYTHMLYGSTNRNAISRFVREIPTEVYSVTEETPAFSYGYNKADSEFSGGNYINERKSVFTTTLLKPQASFKAEPKTVNSSYKKGDKVNHKTFGDGTVISCTPIGNDYLVEINFEQVGVKKLMSGFAKLKKL